MWAKRSRCCHGSLTLLETSSEPRERQFRRVDADGIELYLHQSLGNSEELVIKTRQRPTVSRFQEWASAVSRPEKCAAKPAFLR